MSDSLVPWICVGSMCLIPIGAVWLYLRYLKDKARLNPDACEECGYDLSGGPHERCPECGRAVVDHGSILSKAARDSDLNIVALRDNWPDADVTPRKPGASEMPVVIFETRDSWAAEMLIQHFEARGILSRADCRDVRGGSRKYELYMIVVWSADEEIARAILDEFRMAPPLARGGRLDGEN